MVEYVYKSQVMILIKRAISLIYPQEETAMYGTPSHRNGLIYIVNPPPLITLNSAKKNVVEEEVLGAERTTQALANCRKMLLTLLTVP